MRPARFALAVTSVLAACGSSGGTDVDAASPDAASPDAVSPDAQELDGAPVGPDHTYVISRLLVPTSAAEATALGFDVDQIAGDANGGIDNQLGTFLGALWGIQPELDLNRPINDAVDRGEIIELVNVVAADLTAATNVRMSLYAGDPATATPSPCTDAGDIFCRHHLGGDGQFTLASGAATDRNLDGAIAGGVLHAGPGTLGLRLTLRRGDPPAELTLHRARAEVRFTATGFAGSKLGGGVRQVDVESVLHPALHASWTALVDRDCPMPRTPPNCNCAASSSGAGVLGFLDTAPPRDCVISLAEVTATLNSLITPDLDLFGAGGALGPDGVNDSVSLGIGVRAVNGTFPVP